MQLVFYLSTFNVPYMKQKIWCDRWIVKFGVRNFGTKHSHRGTKHSLKIVTAHSEAELTLSDVSHAVFTICWRDKRGLQLQPSPPAFWPVGRRRDPSLPPRRQDEIPPRLVARQWLAEAWRGSGGAGPAEAASDAICLVRKHGLERI